MGAREGRAGKVGSASYHALFLVSSPERGHTSTIIAVLYHCNMTNKPCKVQSDHIMQFNVEPRSVDQECVQFKRDCKFAGVQIYRFDCTNIGSPGTIREPWGSENSHIKSGNNNGNF